ncbi:hypothetical protein [Streptomyces longwoodensis]|uniref:hypothetical protein n=1 Tax=Streptomyces longwoodensis TaxID=68231 RepID=UPI0038221C28
MQIRRTASDADTVLVALTVEEAVAIQEDLGQITASKLSMTSVQLYSLLDTATEAAPCTEPSYGGYLAHRKRGETACDGCKAAKRAYDRERYAKDPRKARAPQRAYEARKRAAAA